MELFKNLPIYQEFEKIAEKWSEGRHLILRSPTGSGKSLALPYLLKASKLASGKIIVVQPRRIAARMLARNLARMANWTLGNEVGYQVRFDKKYGDQTQIIYATDGIALNKLLGDEDLDDVGTLILDEFHERSAQIDLCLALAIELCKRKNSNFRLVVTSATLDIEALEKFIPQSVSLEISGRFFPVQIEYRAFPAQHPSWKSVVEVIPSLLDKIDGDILVFLDGAYEINKTVNKILSCPWSRGLDVRPLYGDLSPENQDLAILPNQRRKIIVSTNIAETSLTIEGVTLVIDSGRTKKMRYDSTRAINALLSEPISKSSADQRAGRAGRTAPGFCLRLWSKAQHEKRSEFDTPEISRIDLSEIYLNLAAANLRLDQLNILEPISKKSINEAEDKLRGLGAINDRNNLTDHGLNMGRLPIHPSWAHALLIAKKEGIVPAVALVLSMLEGRPIVKFDTLGDFFPMRNPRSDIYCMLLAFEEGKRRNFSFQHCKELGIHAGRCSEAERLTQTLCDMVGVAYNLEIPNYESLARSLLDCFPCHIAALVSEGRRIYEDAYGRRLHLSKHSVLGSEKFVLFLQVLEKKISGRLVLEMEWANGLDQSWLRESLGSKIVLSTNIVFDQGTRNVIKRKTEAWGNLTLSVSEKEEPSPEEKAKAYANALMCGDLRLKNWNTQVDKFLDRQSFLASEFPELGIAKMDDETKFLFFEQLCKNASSWREIKNLEVYSSLLSCFSNEEISLLNQAAPETYDLRTGKRPSILNYSQKTEVILPVLLQDLYDVKTHPTIVFGKYPLIIEILAPNRKPVQRTSDLLSFWEGTYPLVRKDLAGRYPKHEWR